MKIYLAIFSLLLLSGCSVTNSSLFIDNSTCRKSLSNGISHIIKSDSSVEDLISNSGNKDEQEKTIEMLSDRTSRYYAKKIEVHGITLGVNIDDAKFLYDFLFQKESNECWLRLYRRERKSGKSSSKIFNTLTFIDSYKLELCKCGGTTGGIAIQP